MEGGAEEDEKGKLVLCHFNVRGLVAKEEPYKEWLVKEGVECAGVAESHTTWHTGCQTHSGDGNQAKRINPGLCKSTLLVGWVFSPARVPKQASSRAGSSRRGSG